ncbi:MAG: glycosyltransferase family 2 protein [Novosphingobium sp.]
MNGTGEALPTIDVVIVNYRTGPLVVSCLESLEDARRGDGPVRRAIVVDNASPDASADVIESAIAARGWDWVTLLRSPDNGGFGAGNNLGIAWSLAQPERPDLVWLLNPDTRAEPDAAAALARFMAANPRAGIAGSALLEGDGRPWHYAFRFPGILGEVERGFHWGPVSKVLRRSATLRAMGSASEQVDWVSGASCVLRRELLEQGLRFDEGFFLYYEETDLCRRARQAGWECWFVPQSRVLHISGQSTGVTDVENRLRPLPSYWFDSRRRYFVKNHGVAYTALADLGWLAGHLFASAKQRLRREPDFAAPGLTAAFIRHALRLTRPERNAA